ncbi:MAG: Zn-dependent hydrolase [Tissierellia bacterium]|nr:Zn-dependent hydrolase [Tissierellia bacterium]
MKINITRIMKDLETFATFNQTPGEGVTRLSFTKEDQQARDYLVEEFNKYQLPYYTDGYGTLFAKYGEGKESFLIGSHFDTVRHGGEYDGILGVVCGLEVLRVLQENQVPLRHPLELVCMNDEEGVRFAMGVANSRAMIGEITTKDLKTYKDGDQSLEQVMEEFGIEVNLEDAKKDPKDLKGYLELHIEQGPVLDQEDIDIGIVKTIQGISRTSITFEGRAGHAGTTPMDMRKDALLAGAEFITHFNHLVKSYQGPVGTVGELEITPNTSNVIPGKATIYIDIRGEDFDQVLALTHEALQDGEKIGKAHGLTVHHSDIYSVPTSEMDKDLMEKIEEACIKNKYSYKIMNSGAGHDAMNMEKITPSAMIFVKSEKGISHSPLEYTSPEDIEKGAQVMLDTVLNILRE